MRGNFMIKIYVVDTNILLQAPYAIESFEDNLVVLPMAVLEELDHFKKAEGETGANARRVIRYLEQLRQKGDLLKGVPLDSGGTLCAEKNFVDVKLPEDLSDGAADNRILRVCAGLSQSRDEQVILVTKDLLLRIKAQMLGICAEDFTTDQVLEHENQYSGRCELYVPEELFKEFKKKGVPVDQTYVLGEDGENYVPKLEENQFVVLKSDQSAKKTQLGRVTDGMIRKLEFRKSAPYGISPRNAGQYFLQEALNYMRGRSIVKTYLIIDEAQNTTPDQIKGIITRAGKDTKIILLGDPNQIDRPFLDERTNGLSYASEHMKGSPLCWQITMTAQECERSALAMEAVRRL